MDWFAVLNDLCTSVGVNGEIEAAETAARYLREYTDDVRVDRFGNVVGYLPAEQENAPTLLLEAHIDEIGFVVTGTDDNGFVRVSPCGGIDKRTLSATEVVVFGKEPYGGVFCSTPPHLMEADAPVPAVTDSYIDVGMNGEQAKEQIPVGSRVSFRPHFDRLLNDCVSAKALDDRAGVMTVLGAFELVKGKALPFNLVVSFCVQEEIGGHGAKVMAFTKQPDAAIAVDVSFAYTPGTDKNQCGELGKGVMLGYSPILDTHMTTQLRKVAKRYDIPLQDEVMGGRTGTDADVITVAGRGIPTALLSVPLKYMHSPIEVASMTDIQSVSRLMAAFISEGTV